MDYDQLLLKCLTIAFCVAAATLGGCEAYSLTLKSKLLKDTPDPISTSCAYHLSSEALCLTRKQYATNDIQ